MLLGLLAIPLYLIAAVAASRAPVGVDWPRLGVLFAGSLRATACAIAIALPLGFATAMFSAHFCAPRLRAWLKPALEMLEAIPTVVLGLVAATSFAPWLKTHVATLLALMVALPSLLLAAGFAFGRPSRHDGWLPLTTLPLLCAAVAGGLWLSNRLDATLIVPASPWNATLVGLALGIAALPLVFSVAEDALFLVPRDQIQAAFALGATRWQALTTVLLPAAGAGLFAAAVLGVGRCFGETMIVLMASGNTPVGGMDPLIGLRALGADIALGLPDAAPASAVWRDLLVATLALLASTVLLSLAARAVRVRLRHRLHVAVPA
ncbi:MAG TPA: ABC transporter permease subunit [Dokdonella sp.]|nr:ABC transporter permease subunit [Dokdonella sp.]